MMLIFLEFLRLGLTSFGGPTAHVGYFRARFVTRLGWLSEAEFAEMLALAQFLPGPASSQLGFAIGLRRGGAAGALAAFLGFTLPSALIMAAAGIFAIGALDGPLAGALAGLPLVAVAVVAQALWGMFRALCPDDLRRMIAGLVTLVLLLFPVNLAQIAALAAAAAFGALFPRALQGDPRRFGADPRGAGAGGEPPAPAPRAPTPAPRVLAPRVLTRPQALLAAGLVALVLGLAALPFAQPYLGAGALVFGGGHVVLPLLREALPTFAGAMFLEGYGLAQAMPGPLFTFASYLGGASGGWAGALIATLAIFAPGFALMAVGLPLWARLRRIARLGAAVAAVNAAVVGVLAAAWFTQILPHALSGPWAMALAVGLTVLAFVPRMPPLALVVLGALGGAALF